MGEEALLETDLPYPRRQGKVRDVYDLGDALLIVATDRISAFDVIMPNGIPGKGKILTALSAFWFEKLLGIVENHLISLDTADFPAKCQPFAELLRGRSMLVKKAEVAPIECVARGYLAGSGWKEYQEKQSVCGVKLPAGLRQCERLPEAIFTPATKATSGHDENISLERACGIIGEDHARRLRDLTLRLYRTAGEHAAGRGVIIADTKFEFGRVDGKVILVDEALTPDSSRFWPAEDYAPGRDQASFDKQFVRNWLETQAWDKRPPAPRLPEEVVGGTKQKYLEAFERLTGKAFGG